MKLLEFTANLRKKQKRLDLDQNEEQKHNFLLERLNQLKEIKK